MESQLFNFFEKFFQNVQKETGNTGNAMGKILSTIFIIVLWYWVNRITRAIAEKYIKNIKTINWVVRVFTTIFSFIFGLALIWIWLDIQDSILFVLLFLITLVLLAGRDLFGNVVGRLILLQKNYFKLYDRIEINGMKGEVIKIRLFSFEVMELGNWFSSDQPTGRTIRIPNEMILTNAVYNYNRLTEVIWTEAIFKVTVDSDWQRALEIIMNTAKEIAEPILLENFDNEKLEEIKQEIQLFNGSLKQDDIVRLETEGIVLKAHFPVHFRQRTKVKTLVYKEGLKRLNEAPGIELLGYALHVLHEDKIKIKRVEE